MAFKIDGCDNIRETFTGAASTTISLAGAAQFSNAASTKLSNGDVSWWVARAGAEFSEGYFTFNTGTPNTLTQTTVKKSSNGNAAVSFSSGAAGEAYIDLPSFVLDHLNLLEATLASAATTDLGSLDSKCIELTGTTNPTSFGASKNKERLVRYTGAGLTITNSSTLVCPGAKNLPLTTGDIFYAVSDNTATPIWRILWVRRAGPPVTVVRKQIFAASGTYTPDPNLLYAIVDVVGGGGGGGGVAGTVGNLFVASGGGAGSYAWSVIAAATIGASQTVTIGAGGAGGTAGANNGSAGGDTSLGALVIGKGGSGGQACSVAAAPTGTAGGVAGTGDFTSPGAPGGSGFYNGVNALIMTNTGQGGSSVFGGGANGSAFATATATAGVAAAGYGCGGSGANVTSTTGTAAGGAGFKGVVRIIEYCSQ